MSLELISIAKSFGEKNILDNFSYKFKDEGIYAIIGDSGIGKTTLLRIIAGLDKDFSGTVIDGGAQNVSFAFQEYRLFPNLTAIQNITECSFAAATPEEITKARTFLAKLRFSEEDMNLLPEQLSGGMKQRVSLARAFLKNTKILILDEPTKELDPEISEIVLNLMKDEGKKRLVIFVTHRQDDVVNLNCEILNMSIGKL